MRNLPLILCPDTQSRSPLRNQCFQVSQTTPKPNNPGNTGNPHSCLVFGLSFRPLCSWGRMLKEAAIALFRKLSQSQPHASSQFFKGFVTSAPNLTVYFWTEIYRWTTRPNTICTYRRTHCVCILTHLHIFDTLIRKLFQDYLSTTFSTCKSYFYFLCEDTSPFQVSTCVKFLRGRVCALGCRMAAEMKRNKGRFFRGKKKGRGVWELQEHLYFAF